MANKKIASCRVDSSGHHLLEAGEQHLTIQPLFRAANVRAEGDGDKE